MHLVTKNTVDFTCNSTQFGKEAQNQLGFLLEKDFYPKLENLLNLYDETNDIWKIEFLNIDIGKIEKKNWKEVMVNKVLLQIEEYLKTNKPITNFKKTELEVELLNEEYQENNEVFSEEKHAKMLFFNFLKCGSLAENAIDNDLQEIIKKIIIDDAFVQELVAIFHIDSQFILRYLFSVPKNFKKAVFDLLMVKIDEEILQDVIKNYQNADEKILNFHQKTTDRGQQYLWLEYLEWMILLAEKSHSSPIFIEKFLKQSKKYWNISEVEIHTVFKYFVEIGNHFEKNHLNFFEEIIKTSKEIKKPAENDKFQEITVTEKSKIVNSIFVENAGLVILHPFLQTLFERLNLCKKDIWNNEKCQQKAILLLQYLVTGNEEIQEHELFLNKILCGLDQNEIVNTKLKITKTEKEQCENLLKAVLEHWTAMRNSSSIALQETFLQRKGKVEESKENQFEIWVEEKGFDILLNQLPWGIGMIKTPWMNEFLICNW